MEMILQQPKNTFSNLPDDKRNSIVEIALQEFAAQGYRKASMNTIVKRLGIAKGSLYQYFENKEALFLYIFQFFVMKVKANVRAEIMPNGHDDFFEYVKKILWAGVRFINDHPAYFEIYLQVLHEPDVPYRGSLVSQVRLFSADFFGPLIEQARQGGTIRQDVTPETVVFVVDALLERFLHGYARPNLDAGLELSEKSNVELHDEIERIITVLRDGLKPQ